jgi:ribosomal protein L12E/L44/L45/RPP1/RPP2
MSVAAAAIKPFGVVVDDAVAAHAVAAAAVAAAAAAAATAAVQSGGCVEVKAAPERERASDTVKAEELEFRCQWQ